MGGVATPRDNFGKIKAIPGQSGLKQIFGTLLGPFQDTSKKSGTVLEIPGQLATMRVLTSVVPFDYTALLTSVFLD